MPTAEKRDPTWNLVPAALLLGLALQTHPSVLALLPGVALTVALARPRLVFSRWALFSLLAVIAGYANMVVFNLQNDFQSVRFAEQIRAEYAGEGRPFGHQYLANLGTLLLGLFRMIGGAIEDRTTPLEFLADPALLGSALVVIAGLAWSTRSGDRLPLLVTLSAVTLLPLVNDRYEPITDGRYLTPLLPLLFGAVSPLAVDALRLGRPNSRTGDQSLRYEVSPRKWKLGARFGASSASLAARGISVLAVALLILAPLAGLRRYSEQNASIAARGSRLLAAFQIAQKNLPPGNVVIVDHDLRRVVLGAGSTELLAFEYAFSMRQVPYSVERVTPRNLAATMARQPAGRKRLVVMERAKRKLLDHRLQVKQLTGNLSGRAARHSAYGVYLMSWQGGS